MTTACISVCFGMFLTFSLFLYLGEIILNGIFVYSVRQDSRLKGWFVPMIAFLLLPMVTVQLVSAILLLLKRGDKLTSLSSLCIAVLHIFQLGFIWRHIALFREVDPVVRVTDTMDLNLLQVVHTFASMLPLLLIQTFMIIQYELSDWLTLATVCVTLTATCWFLASFRRHHQSDDMNAIILTWPGTVFRVLWRAGEITSRLISLSVFASVYFYWVFLILGLHWVTMLVCICTSVLGMFDNSGLSGGYKFSISLLVSYMYSFCFVNFTSQNSAFRYVVYYVIMFLENAVLTVVWYIKDEPSNSTKVNSITFISVCAFFIGIISLGIYYRFFHLQTTVVSDGDKEHVIVPDGCINCRLSLCSKHNIKLQRPFSAGWISQYQQALHHGNYYKNIMQDSFMDSMTEWETVSSLLSTSDDSECHQLRDVHDAASGKQYNSIQASGTYAHKRFFDSSHDLTADSDTDSTSILDADADGTEWFQVGSNSQDMSQFSDLKPLSVCSSRTHLLTDSWDSLLQAKTGGDLCNHTKKLDLVSSLIRKDMDSGRSSDGYSTDHTLDSYQLPVTVLAKKRQKYLRRVPAKTQRTYSTASDSTDCTICAFLKHHHTHSPGNSVRSSLVYEKIPEETLKEMRAHRAQDRKPDSGNRKQRETARSLAVKEHRERKSKHIPAVHKSSDRTVHRSSTTKHTSDVHNVYAVVNKPRRPVVKTNNTSLTYGSDSGDSAFPRATPTCASDSGDSAFPRATPLSAYLAATDDDGDGTSESSLEMVI